MRRKDRLIRNDSNVRNSNVEILRIIAAVLIVLSHYARHGINMSQTGLFNRCFLNNIALGNLGVDIFLIISGYFNVKAEFKWHKILKLWTQVFTYSIFGLLIALATKQNISFRNFITALFPAIFNQYWFFTAYLVLLVLSPFINKLLLTLKQKDFSRLLITMLVLWSLLELISQVLKVV